jgi:hypothetical protein
MRLPHISFGKVLAGTAVLLAVTTGTAYAITVTSADIVNGTIRSVDIGTGEVKGVDIGNGTIRSADIFNGGVKSADVLDDSLLAADLAPNSVGFSEIQTDAVQASESLHVGVHCVLDDPGAQRIHRTEQELGDGECEGRCHERHEESSQCPGESAWFSTKHRGNHLDDEQAEAEHASDGGGGYQVRRQLGGVQVDGCRGVDRGP